MRGGARKSKSPTAASGAPSISPATSRYIDVFVQNGSPVIANAMSTISVPTSNAIGNGKRRRWIRRPALAVRPAATAPAFLPMCAQLQTLCLRAPDQSAGL
jgi:hypothetical protein